MDIAITGGAGFIGSNVAKRLLEQGHNVHLYDARLPDNAFKQQIWDAANSRNLIDLSTTQPDFCCMDRVINLAANMGGVGFFHNHDFWPYLDNSRITFNVFEAIIKAEVPKSFTASSACIYPIQMQQVEGLPPKLAEWMIGMGKSDQMYGHEKLMMAYLSTRADANIRAGVLHTVYGIGQEHQGERMKFPTAAATKVLHAAKHGGPVEIWGNGRQMRSYLYVDDAVTKILNVLESDEVTEPINIGYEGAVSCLEIVNLLCDLEGIRPEYVYTHHKPSGVLARDCDNSGYNSIFGKDDNHTPKQGFEKLLMWLKSLQ